MDGNTSTEADPTHIFTVAGTYNVSLLVTDGEGLNDTEVITIIVNDVSGNLPPVADATAVPTMGEAPLPVLFNSDGSSDDVGIETYLWDFMDGFTSQDPNPNHIFENAGVYEVTLTVTDEGGLSNTTTVTITVTAPANLAPEAIATATPDNGDAPLEVSFIGSTSTDDVGVTEYSWDFGDGTTANIADPVHIYDDPGVYFAVLTVQDAEGLTDAITLTITVNAPNQAPNAVATATPEMGSAPLEVTFIGSGSTDDVAVTSYSWDFGDGNTSDVADPVHTYQTPGVYFAVLTVEDIEGLSDIANIMITVNEPNPANEAPVAIASATPLTGEAPLEVSFVGSSSTDDIGVVTYAWDFADGNTATDPDPVHIFTFAGTFEVTLTVTDAEGLTDTTTITIEVEDATPTATEEMQAIAVENPVATEARIVILNQSITVNQVFLHDSTGRLIGTYDPVSIQVDGEYVIPVLGIRDGVYYVIMEMNEGDPLQVSLLVGN